MDNYDDIIDMPYGGVKRHQPMQMEARAAQFAPFAALTGHEAAISATAQKHINSFNTLTTDDDQQSEYSDNSDI